MGDKYGEVDAKCSDILFRSVCAMVMLYNRAGYNEEQMRVRVCKQLTRRWVLTHDFLEDANPENSEQDCTQKVHIGISAPSSRQDSEVKSERVSAPKRYIIDCYNTRTGTHKCNWEVSEDLLRRLRDSGEWNIFFAHEIGDTVQTTLES